MGPLNTIRTLVPNFLIFASGLLLRRLSAGRQPLNLICTTDYFCPTFIDVFQFDPPPPTPPLPDERSAIYLVTFLNVSQVLMGDLKPAIEQHEVLYQITKRHHFLPEAVTSDFQVSYSRTCTGSAL